MSSPANVSIFVFTFVTLFHLTWILAVIGLMHFSVRKWFSQPDKRYLVGLISLACVVSAIPTACWLVAQDSQIYHAAFQSDVSEIERSHGSALTTSPAKLETTATVENADQADEKSPVVTTSSKTETSSLLQLIAVSTFPVSIIYMIGVSAMLIRLCLMLVGIHWLTRNALPVTNRDFIRVFKNLLDDYGLKNHPRLLSSGKIAVPFATGVWQSSILIPTSMLSGLSVYEIRSILAHELAHIRRHDPWVLMLQRIVETLLFFHPVTWWICRDLSRNREYCCDQMVVRTGVCPVDYAKTLCKVAELTQDNPFVENKLGTAISGDSPTELVNRIRTLLHPVSRSKSGLTDLRSTLPLLTVSLTVLVAMCLFVSHGHGEINDPVASVDLAPSYQDQEKDEKMELKFRFESREHQSDYKEGLEIAMGLIKQAEAEDAPSAIVAKLYHGASSCARMVQLRHRDESQRTDMAKPIEILRNITDNPNRFLGNYDTAKWYTNCTGLLAAVMQDSQKRPREIESFLSGVLDLVNDSKTLTEQERLLLECDIRLDIADMAIDTKKWKEATEWMMPIFEKSDLLLNDTRSAYRLAMAARQQSMFLSEAGNHEACVQLIDDVCEKLESAKTLSESDRLRFQCMLRGRQFVNYGDGKHPEVLKNAIKEFEALTVRAQSFSGPGRPALLCSCTNMHRLACFRDDITKDELRKLISRVMTLIESERGIQKGRYSAFWNLQNMLDTAVEKLDRKEMTEIKNAIKELKRRAAKNDFTAVDR